MSGQLPQTSELMKGMGIPANCVKTNTHKTDSEFASPLIHLHTQRHPGSLSWISGSPLPAFKKYPLPRSEKFDVPLSYGNMTACRR